MIPVSDIYRGAVQLHQTQGFRNQMFAEVSLGLFADGAKENSTYSISSGLPYSDAQNMYSDEGIINQSYVTFEKDGGFPLDSSGQIFVPMDGTGHLEQGYTSKSISKGDGSFATSPYVDIAFRETYSAVGLTFEFDKRVGGLPKEVVVTAYNGTSVVERYDLTDISEYDFKPETPLDDFTRLRIEFVEAKPYQRIRLNGLQIGIGYVYSGENLISVSHNRSNHPLSMALPQSSLEFTVYNEDNRFDIDSDSSVVRFLSTGQKAALRYGYDLTGQGYIEWFNAGTFYLDTWDTQGSQATFRAKDLIHNLSKTVYKKGVFDTEYHFIHSLAEDVLSDAKVDVYELPVSFDSTQLPLPYISYAECLQLLANHSCGILTQNAKGELAILRKYLLPREKWTLTPPYDEGSEKRFPYTDLTAIIGDEECVEYVTWEENRFPLDGGMYLAPNSSPYLPAGAVYNIFPKDYGVLLYPDSWIEIDLGRNTSFGELEIRFSNYSKNATVYIECERQPNGIVYQKAIALSGNVATLIEPFENLRWIRIYPNTTETKHRFRILNVRISQQTGLQLTDDDVLGNRTATLMPETKSVSVQHFGVWYWNAGYSEELMRVKVLPNVMTEIKHSDVYYYLTVSSENSNVVFEHVEHYAYTSFIRISGVTEETEIILWGAPYSRLDERRATRVLSETGEEVAVDNPISKQEAVAEHVADWMADYYSKRHQYEVDVLGYPECDAGDYILYNGKEVVVLENNITISGGAMRGKMKLRGGN